VDAPSLQAFKARLDVALGSLGCWLVGDPAHSRGLEVDEHCGPFQPRPFCDPMRSPDVKVALQYCDLYPLVCSER